MNEKLQYDARACLGGIASLAGGAAYGMSTELAVKELVPLRVLLDRAEALLDGKVEARGRKNAGDRKRRARKKTPGKKPRDKDPTPLVDGEHGVLHLDS